MPSQSVETGEMLHPKLSGFVLMENTEEHRRTSQHRRNSSVNTTIQAPGEEKALKVLVTDLKNESLRIIPVLNLRLGMSWPLSWYGIVNLESLGLGLCIKPQTLKVSVLVWNLNLVLE